MARKGKNRSRNATPAAERPLPHGWRMMRFGDVVRNCTAAERDPLAAGFERYVGLEHIEPECLKIKSWGLVADGTSFTRVFRKGQVLFAKRRAYQRKVAVADFDGICSSDILVFEPKGDELIPELLPFIVQSDGFFEHALGTSAGSLSPRTRWSQLKEYEFPLPPRDEQRRIADILWAAEEAFERYRQALYEAEKLRRVVLFKLMREGIGHTTFKETPLGRLPAAWRVVRVCEAGEVLMGRQRSPKYQTGKHSRPYLRVANVYDGFFELSDVLQMEFNAKDFEAYRLKPGDILLVEGHAEVNQLGRPAMWNGQIENCCFQNTLLRFRGSDRILPEFALAFFQSEFYGGRFAAVGQITSISHLSLGRFAKLLMPLPALTEQRAIADQITRISEREAALRSHVAALANAKTSLRNEFLSHDTRN